MLRASLLLLVVLPAAAETASVSPVRWESWSNGVFARARKEHRLVLLDLEAVWCHWCHVMDKTTYQDPRVVALLAERYIAVKVDQDARPDLSGRYQDYGWPATVIFDAGGRELAKRRGYIAPEGMAGMLKAFADDPTPGPSVRPERRNGTARSASLTAALREELERRHVESYDDDAGGWGTGHKYVDWPSVEYALQRAGQGDAEAERRARQTLTAGLALLDPAWGGVYQYSTGGVWSEPHFEKLAQFQGELMRLYALSYRRLGDESYLRAAREIARFVASFLTSPEGGFYASQDADLVPGEHSADYFALDDGARRRLGVPRVDRHVYARENGWLIRGLAELTQATREPETLRAAVRAAEWVLAHRALPGGGFAHGEEDAGGPFLGDTLAMAQAFLALHTATGESRWLERAEECAHYLEETWRRRSPRRRQAQSGAEQNAALVRLGVELARRTGKDFYRGIARQAMRYLAAPAVARAEPPAPLLLADWDLRDTSR